MRSINVTMLGHWKNPEGSITILSDRGSACIGSLTINEIKNWEFVPAHPMNAEIHATSYQTNSACVFGHPLRSKSP